MSTEPTPDPPYGEMVRETMRAAMAAQTGPMDDIHRVTAAKIFGVNLQDVTDEMRKVGKRVNFANAWGVEDVDRHAWEPTGWWRVVRVDFETLWCETSSEEEAREAADSALHPMKVQRMMRSTIERWEDA